jgi:hypothetical protein
VDAWVILGFQTRHGTLNGNPRTGHDRQGHVPFASLHQAGLDEMDEASGSGSTALLDDGSLEIEFAYHRGDEAVLKAERATSPAPG